MNAAQRLDSVCELTMGQAPTGDSYNTEGNGLPLIAGAGDFGEIHPAAKKFTTVPGKVCRAGDIVIGIRATIGEKVIADREYCLGRGVAGLRPKSTLDGRYLWHWLTQVVPILVSKAKGATFKQVNREDIGGLPISLPPLSEQQRIAETLDRAETLRERRYEAIAQLDTLTQAIFHSMFGDATTILGSWPTGTLGESLEFLTSGSRGWAKYYAETGAMFLRIQNVRRDELILDDIAHVKVPDTAETKRTRVRPGDVLLSITADLGRTAVVPDGIGPAFINQHLAILRTTALDSRFLSAYLASPAGQQQIAGCNRQGVKAGLNFDDIRSLILPLPPIELQRDFVRRVAAVDRLRNVLRSSAAELNKLFISLKQRAFPGALG